MRSNAGKQRRGGALMRWEVGSPMAREGVSGRGWGYRYTTFSGAVELRSHVFCSVCVCEHILELGLERQCHPRSRRRSSQVPMRSRARS